MNLHLLLTLVHTAVHQMIVLISRAIVVLAVIAVTALVIVLAQVTVVIVLALAIVAIVQVQVINMKSRDEIVIEMCKAYRTSESVLVTDETRENREAVFKLMGQLYDNVIAKHMEPKKDA